MELKFNDYYQGIIDEIESKNTNMIILGYAGSGKSTLLNYIVSRGKKEYVVLAPTGIAALNVGGSTIHSFFKFNLGILSYSNISDIRDTSNHEIMIKCDTIIIDEISMVRADMMDAIDISLRKNLQIDLPFGGKQIVCFGDLSQLPPVVTSDEKPILKKIYKTAYFFDSNVAWTSPFRYKLLKENYRQSEDKTFNDILNRMRINKTTMDDIDVINKYCTSSYDENAKENKYVPFLCTTNKVANNINDRKLRSIKETLYSYETEIYNKFNPKSCIAEEILLLKEGAKIMMLNNDACWSNGTIGYIKSLSFDKITVDIKGREYEVLKQEWESRSYTIENGRISTNITGKMVQYPIKLAYATTIHKFQGMQSDRVRIDLSSNLFAYGQLYVALSRCTTISGISLSRNISRKDIKVDKKVLEFMDDVYESNY